MVVVFMLATAWTASSPMAQRLMLLGVGGPMNACGADQVLLEDGTDLLLEDDTCLLTE